MNHFHQPTSYDRPPAAAIRTCRHLLLAACGWAVLATSAFANPAEEITRAVAANGAADVSQARPRQFVKAFTAVALRARPRELPDYVIAAVNLRPDLAPNLVAVAVKAAMRNWETKPQLLCLMIERIVKAAVTANPDRAASIAKAAISAAPTLRRYVVSGAIAGAPFAREEILEAAAVKTPPLAFLTFSASDSSGFSYSAATLSPANISDLTSDDLVNSPEQPPSR